MNEKEARTAMLALVDAVDTVVSYACRVESHYGEMHGVFGVHGRSSLRTTVRIEAPAEAMLALREATEQARRLGEARRVDFSAERDDDRALPERTLPALPEAGRKEFGP